VAWDLLTELPRLDGFCKYFQNRHQEERYVDRMERRMAEFLVRDGVPLSRFVRMGVCTPAKAAQVQAVLDAAGVVLQVEVKADWYFLGQ